MNALDLAKSLAAESAKWIVAGMPLTPDKIRADRLGACAPCEHLDPDSQRCKVCGCFVGAKVWLATAQCPDTPPRWKAVAGPIANTGQWFFARPENQAALTKELGTWAGTRFAPGIGGNAQKGVGADCVSFVERVLVNVGAIKAVEWPAYVTKGGGESMLALLLQRVGAVPELVKIDDWLSRGLMPGDVLLGSTGRAMHHVSIFAGSNVVWHAIKDHGVCTGNIFDPIIAKHTVAVFRARYL